MDHMLGSLVWLNGQFVEVAQANVGVADRGFTLGDGLFETMLWTGTRIRFLEDHLDRLTASAEALQIPMPVSRHTIIQGLLDLAHKAGSQTAVLRLTLTRGIGARGLGLPDYAQSQILATIAPYNVPLTPVALKVVTIARNPSAPSARFKTLSYIDNIMALQEARDGGADDAIMLGTNGHVACSSSANIILQIDNHYVTPALVDGALPGILRGRLLQAGLIQQAHVTCAMLEMCHSAFLTNALIGLRPIAQINGRDIVSFVPSWMDIICLSQT